MDSIKPQSPADRFCDLVMKGGITSGIVYPPLVYKLSQYYRFKNIGGTSAGAIAAAATAAAEYRRRQTGSSASFDVLHKLPGVLAELGVDGRSKLLSLFQPAPGCHRLFRVLTQSLNASGTLRRIGAVILGLLLGYWIATVLALGISAWIWSTHGTAVALLAGFILLILFIGAGLCWDILRVLPRNWYGMCSGMTVTNSVWPSWLARSRSQSTEALTPWLHDLVQQLAGLKSDDPPLTFGQLWAAEGFPPSWLEVPSKNDVRSIDLRMFTTNLSTGRPFIFPMQGETCRLFYLPEELGQFLPKSVMDELVKHSKPYAPNATRPGSDPHPCRAPNGLLELPEAKDFPVLLAARMSLSFPLLFSAVPLWAIDYDPKKEVRTFGRCMFSDGGISSNFPVHLFDAFLPMWPTFGVQLEGKYEGHGDIFLPKRYLEGYGERWNRFAAEKSSGKRMGGFLSAIVLTMQNWNDNTLSRMPGVRDRVVRVRLDKDEGGLNLNMPPDIIKAVAKKGEEAATKELIARFVENDGGSNDGWDDQRWIRFNVLLRMLQERFSSVGLSVNSKQPHATGYRDIITSGLERTLPGEIGVLTTEQVDALHGCIDAMLVFNTSLNTREHASAFEIVPETDLRVKPSL